MGKYDSEMIVAMFHQNIGILQEIINNQSINMQLKIQQQIRDDSYKKIINPIVSFIFLILGIILVPFILESKNYFLGVLLIEVFSVIMILINFKKIKVSQRIMDFDIKKISENDSSRIKELEDMRQEIRSAILDDMENGI